MPRYVSGEGPQPCDLMFIGEGPGAEEDKYGRPFVGKSGKELNRYLWRATGRTRTSVYVTNLVKYRVPDNEDPTPEDIKRDAPALRQELRDTRPDIIVSLGRHSTRHFLGDVDMEAVHGIPRFVDGGLRVLMPVYHPAAGLHSTEFQALIYWDFEQLGKLLRGDKVQWAAEDEYPSPIYKQVPLVHPYSRASKVAVDTEGSVVSPWCLSAADIHGQAVVWRPGGLRPSPFLGRIILHNSLHDLVVLRAMGVEVGDEDFDDTMIKAYELCVEPQGLKALALRHCGMVMQDYSELVAPANRLHAKNYMIKVVYWLNNRSSSASQESITTTSKSRRRISANAGKRSSKTASRKK